MNKKLLHVGLPALGLLTILAAVFLTRGSVFAQETREGYQKLYNQGNYKAALEGYKKLALDAKTSPAQAGNDMNMALYCLRNLGRTDEVDDLRDSVIKAHAGQWEFMRIAANSFLEAEHFGYIVAGKYYRGHHRGGGRMVSSYARDRLRAIQLMDEGLQKIDKAPSKNAAARFLLDFADLVLRGSAGQEAWRLQVLSDFSLIPEYEDTPYWNPYHGVSPAPVDENGNPVFHKLPASYEKAATDGERWRWLLQEAPRLEATVKQEASMRFASFLHSQFGPQTLAGFFPGFMDDTKAETGAYALASLKDGETIARIAAGIKRLSLPEEFNYLSLWKQVAGEGKSTPGMQARELIAHEYENRRQLEKAAEGWKNAIKEYGDNGGHGRGYRLQQIIGNWGRFEPAPGQTPDINPTLDFRFRNAKEVEFEAFEVLVDKLLTDVKKYLPGRQGQLDWQKLNISDVGQRLVYQNETAYIGKKAGQWKQKLTPRPGHNDARVQVEVPKLPGGAYLVVAKLEGGNTSRVVLWINDLAIVRKNIDGQSYYFVADAISGAPEAGAKLDFFGWRQEQVRPNQNQYRVVHKEFAKTLDADGQTLLDSATAPANMQWLVVAKGANNRQAYLGFSHFWFQNYQDHYFQQAKAFAITDRPVYRPGQKVEFKLWAAQARYDLEGPSQYAGKDLHVVIRNPKGDKVYEKTLRADAHGGVAGNFDISKDSTLGVYYLGTENGNPAGGVQFRIEEYKKPEFEVKVEAPEKPVMLGEKVPVTLSARYYFGAPVAKGKAKIKVLRQSKTTDWYPLGVWDWFYGRGYWWFAPDYHWYTGFEKWGCMRPWPWWYPRVQGPPEIVLEQESPIGPDGTVKLEIDTGLAKQFHGNQDHEYSITAEVTDESRRVISGSGKVIVARKPFRVFTWLARGHYRTGDTVEVSFQSQTPDGKPVAGMAEVTLYQITYDKEGKPVEKAVDQVKMPVREEGKAAHKFVPRFPGQFRVAMILTDEKGRAEEGAYLFNVYGKDFDTKKLRFNDLELILDKREFAPGETAQLLINTNRENGTVLLFSKPVNGVAKAPKVIRLQGKSTQQGLVLTQADMPNTFVEAISVSNGKLHTEMKELIIPPEKRVLNVQVETDQAEYKPGQKAKVKVKVTGLDGKPVSGSVVLSVYDRSVDYIAGGSNVPDIKDFFWKWRRRHSPSQETSLSKNSYNLLKQNETGMGNIGIFGATAVEEFAGNGMGGRSGQTRESSRRDGGGLRENMEMDALGLGAPGGFGGGYANNAFEGRALMKSAMASGPAGDKSPVGQEGGQPEGENPMLVQPGIRKNFADTALWIASLDAGPDGTATAELTMPENLTGWKVHAWSMANGTRVGDGETIVTTKKDLLVRLQAPRFFTQNDEVILSANVHNYLKDAKTVEVSLELDGNVLKALSPLTVRVPISPKDEKRVDWKVKVVNEGQAVVRVKALTDVESDAMEMRFTSYIHGMLRTESYSGAIRPGQTGAKVQFTVGAERRINDSKLEIRYSPTLAGAMVDALPYLADYPYGCTEQTLNRFVPTVITLSLLERMKIDLAAVRDKRANLNAQEIGDPQARAKGWKRFPSNPVFDPKEVREMAASGVKTLQGMQVSDGGWGWFSGYGEYSSPHTTAVVVHGLQIAREHGIQLPPQMLERGIAWLKAYQQRQVELIKRAPAKVLPYKDHADDMDAFAYMILLDADVANNDMMEFLYRDRTKISVYGKALFGIAMHKQKQNDKLQMILKNISQYLVQDEENQTAYLKLPPEHAWWYWHGNDTETNAWYLKLLARTDPKGETPSRLAKYILNNRKHGAYWDSTRATAFCIEALAEFFKASGEDAPDMTVEVLLDGRKLKEVAINASNLFTFDGTALVMGDALESGEHTLELKKKGKGPLYFNAYVSVFTLETPIKKAGLEVKVNRKYYLLKKQDTTVKAPGARGQAVNQKGEKYERVEIPDLGGVKSGDLVEIEMEIDSKNDYEYLLLEDMKGAGFEPVEIRSGYGNNDMRAYMELRDDRVSFFLRTLARGKHSLRYRLRAEIPGVFHALPAKMNGMYAPELRANSDEIRVLIEDAPVTVPGAATGSN
ncbi:MAG: alpha-2-macroglobulin [Gemmataceae bacterium]|nr:alpha-2-macroglobulin [Gemmataceae bacterium]